MSQPCALTAASTPPSGCEPKLAVTPAAAVSYEVRAAAWLSVGMMLAVTKVSRRDAPLLDALIAAAVVDANVAPIIRDPALQAAYAPLRNAPPDEHRRPVSINALAASLGLPFETVRRHVKQLTAHGVLAVAPTGVLVPGAVLAAPPAVAAAKARYDLAFRFYDDLRAMQAVAPLPFTPLDVDHPDAPVRAVNHILSDYYFRTLDALHRLVLDPLTAMVLLGVAHASTAHVPPWLAAAALRLDWIADAERRPVSVYQLSRSLDLPYETTRRHVGWLLERGFCRREQRGVLPAMHSAQGEGLAVIARDNHANVRRMFRQIAALPMAEPDRSAGG